MDTWRKVLIATLLMVLLIGCKPAASSRSSAQVQSPLAAPALSNVTSPMEQSPTLSNKVRASEVTILTRTTVADTPVPENMFFPVALVNSKLYGIGKQASGQLALYEVDLKTGLTRQVGTARKGWGNMHASERYIVWEQMDNSQTYNEIHVYDLQTDQESILATHSAWPDVSGSIVMWGNVQGYDLSKGTPIQIKNLHGKPQRPRISGQWVIYLDVSSNDDTADVYAHHLTTNEDFKIGTMPMLGPRAIGTVEWYPVISGKNVVWVSAQDNQLHHYNLDTRSDRLLPVPLSEEAALSMPRGLELDGDILVYNQQGLMGYDLALDAAFLIPVTPAVQGKWTSSTIPLVSGGRLVWQTQVDQTVNLYTTDIIRNP